jgi:chromosome partitioning protein
MGHVWAIAGEKGGTGKSATAQNLAICLLLLGHRVLVIDGDKQRTTVKFAERRAQLIRTDPAYAGMRPLYCLERRGDMLDVLEEMAARYDFVLVDVAGAETPQLQSAVRGADLLLSPFKPGESDLETAESIAHVVDLVRVTNRSLVARLLLNEVTHHANARAQELQMAHEVLEPFLDKIPLTDTVITARSIVRKAHRQKRGVVEIARSRLAKDRRDAEDTADEYWSLCTEALRLCGVSPIDLKESHG